MPRGDSINSMESHLFDWLTVRDTLYINVDVFCSLLIHIRGSWPRQEHEPTTKWLFRESFYVPYYVYTYVLVEYVRKSRTREFKVYIRTTKLTDLSLKAGRSIPHEKPYVPVSFIESGAL